MTVTAKLNLIKVIHTAIWIFFNAVIFYLCYAAIFNIINEWVWIGIGLVIAEGLVLLLFKLNCPLTLIARKYSTSHKDNFDIFLPNMVARYNKPIYTSIFIVAVAIIIGRLLLTNA
ncbi:MAG TPA: hypothetical protein VFE54_02975 [Mucilaginibacter sp.]|jgi:hypothetical protein|nr:hypothetical protein [Mucilaginibacter sp.]